MMQRNGLNGSELHRLTEFTHYDPKVFNRIYGQCKPLIRKLAKQIDARRYNVSRDIIVSYFEDKLLYVYNKYQDRYDENRLKATILSSLSIYKNKLLRAAYNSQAEFNQELTSFEDVLERDKELVDDIETVEMREDIHERFHQYMREHLTEDEYFHKLQPIVKNLQIEGVVISSVVPSLDLIFVQMIKKYFNLNPMIIAPGIKSGLKLRIEAPKTLGSDLLCDAVGAVNKFGGPVIIVDLGTATKFIVVNDKEEYLGGAIAPGMNGSLNSLIQNAAKLSHTALAKPDNVIGNDTTTCIQSGMIYGTASMIDGMVNKTIEELKLKDNIIIACINRNGSIIIPNGKDKIFADDTVVIVTTNKGFKDIRDILR